MRAWVALLRGVNVGGRGALPMADLRRIAEGCGLAAARTYIQSGNLVFLSDESDGALIADRIRAAVHGGTGLDVPVAVRSAAQMQRVVSGNPFRDADPARLHVTFLLEPGPASLDAVDLAAYAPERAAIAAGELYLHLPGGIGRSRLAADLARRPELAGTTRNWRTVTTLLAMAWETSGS